MKKERMFSILVLLLVAVLAIGSSSSEPSEPEKVGEVSVDNVAEEKGTQIFNVGDVVEVDNIRASITGIEKSQGNQFTNPEDGNEYVFVNMTIENTSNEELNLSSLLCFNSYVDDVVADISFSAQVSKDSNKTMDGTIASGKKIVGNLAYELPVDWENLEIHFEPNFWNNSSIKWIVQNN